MVVLTEHEALDEFVVGLSAVWLPVSTVCVLPVAVGTTVRATIEAAVEVATLTVVLTAVLAVWLTLALGWAVIGAGLASGQERTSRSVCVATGTWVCLLFGINKHAFIDTDLVRWFRYMRNLD